MIRDASPAETLALKTATEVLHMAGLKRVIMLGWPGPHSEGLVLSADDTADGSDCLVAIETFMKLAASMARQNGGNPGRCQPNPLDPDGDSGAKTEAVHR